VVYEQRHASTASHCIRAGRRRFPALDAGFHGGSCHGSSLRSRLKTVFSTRAARLGTLHELTKLGLVPIIADALGYHPSTIERHAIGSASTYAEYMAAVRELKRTVTGAQSRVRAEPRR
jgi:hypothetical protein